MEQLVEWLRQQLADDEQAAKSVHPGPWGAQPPDKQAPWDGGWEVVSDAYRPDQIGHQVVNVGDPVDLNTRRGGVVDEDHARYIARHDPAAVLADVEAKRAVLDMLTLAADPYDPATGVLNEVIRALASAYRHRPGWRDEWE